MDCAMSVLIAGVEERATRCEGSVNSTQFGKPGLLF